MVLSSERWQCLVSVLFYSEYKKGVFPYLLRYERNATSPVILRYVLTLFLRVRSITSSWFGFRHHAHVANIYMSLTLGLSIAIVFLLLKPSADGPKAAKWRAFIIAGLMGTGYTPLIHAYLIGGIERLQHFPWQAAAKMLWADLVGVLFYITRFPESRFPETFDVWGASHQIFHITVVVGRVVYLRGLKELVDLA
ncbi:hypothetical protein PMIN06_009524 [Paraphaeosphaeria minitans]